MVLIKGKFMAVLIATVLIAAMMPVVSIGASTAPQTVWPADSWESDDTSATAKVLPEVSHHTFHQEDDLDWAKISAPASGTVFWIEMQSDMQAGQNMDGYIYIYDSTGTEVGYSDDMDFWAYDPGMVWEAPAAGTFYVEVGTWDSDERGSYYLNIKQGSYGRRLAGATRFETAVQVSRRVFEAANNLVHDDSPDYAVVANGRGYADALAGGVLASLDEGPLLLTEPGTLPKTVADELERLFALDWWNDAVGGTVYVLGGTGAVSPAVMAAIEDSPYVGEVIRLAGANRYGTASEVASQTAADYGSVSTTAVVVGGYAWPDALAAGPVAAWNESVLLLTGKSSVPQETKDAISDLGITDVVVVGGSGVVEDGVLTQLEALVSGDVMRVAGATRYDTARMIAQFGVDNYGMNGQRMTLCPGSNFPDALGAAPISWWNDGGPMLLTGTASLHPTVKEFIDDNGRPTYASSVSDMSYAVGGSGVISDAALAEWQMYKPAP